MIPGSRPRAQTPPWPSGDARPNGPPVAMASHRHHESFALDLQESIKSEARRGPARHASGQTRRECHDGKVSTADLTAFLEFSSMGFTPVTFGDVVRDLRRGVSICSGDLMMLELARAFRPNRAVFAADVDGLFTADPKLRRSALLLESVGPKDLGQIEFSDRSRTDVTGSIEGKVRRMFEIADHAGECLIVNGNVKNR